MQEVNIDFNKTLIRSSAFHLLTKEPKLKADKEAGNLSETAITYLKDVYRTVTTGRQEQVTSKYFEHGNFGEEYAITMLSLHLKKMLKKNDERLCNDFVSGTPDIYLGEDIRTATIGYDTKCPYSIFTMPFKEDKLSEQYEWQNHNYMYLTGATEWNTVYCLVSHNPFSIKRQKLFLWNKLGCDNTGATDEYINGAIEIEKNCIYNISEYKEQFPDYVFDCKEWGYDIPDTSRILIYNVQRDEEKIKYIEQRVEKARQYLISLHEAQTI
jgi:hypothetical protein